MKIFKALFLGTFLILCIGCDMINASKDVTLDFSVDQKTDLSGLRVNIYLSLPYVGWYGYSKKITVIDQGKVLKHKIKTTNHAVFTIEAIDTKRNQHFFIENFSLDTLRTNYKESYIFSDQKVILSSIYQWNISEQGGTYRKDLDYAPLNAGIKPLKLYQPMTDEYQMSEISQEEIDEHTTVTDFETLKQLPKIKEKDILRIANLTHEQKQELIEIHSKLEFYKPES